MKNTAFKFSLPNIQNAHLPIMEYVYLDIPHSNMSIETYDAKHIGFNSGKIKEFYINKKTDTLVLEVEFRRFIVDSPKTVMKHYIKGKEPIIATDFSIVEFKKLSFTLTIPLNEDINPAKGHVYAYLSGVPALKVGPGLLNVKGIPDLRWRDDMVLTAREALVMLGDQFMAVYLQTRICDFRHIKV